MAVGAARRLPARTARTALEGIAALSGRSGGRA
jgi:hypothetical protein